MSIAVNDQILEVILTLGNDAILVAYQIKARQSTNARDMLALKRNAIHISPHANCQLALRDENLVVALDT